MTSYIIQRLLMAIVTLFGVSIVVFGLVQLLPGDPGRVIAGPNASQAEVERLRERMGLDEPLGVQYGVFVGNLTRGDLGTSARTQRPVATEIMARLPARCSWRPSRPSRARLWACCSGSPQPVGEARGWTPPCR